MLSKNDLHEEEIEKNNSSEVNVEEILFLNDRKKSELSKKLRKLKQIDPMKLKKVLLKCSQIKRIG
jgi:hypothetical protein